MATKTRRNPITGRFESIADAHHQLKQEWADAHAPPWTLRDFLSSLTLDQVRGEMDSVRSEIHRLAGDLAALRFFERALIERDGEPAPIDDPSPGIDLAGIDEAA